jgi:hypothetical protein
MREDDLAITIYIYGKKVAQLSCHKYKREIPEENIN